MLKKSCLVVGVILAATLAIGTSASASTRRFSRLHIARSLPRAAPSGRLLRYRTAYRPRILFHTRMASAGYGYRMATAHYGYRYARLGHRRPRVAFGPQVAAAPQVAAPQAAAPFASFNPLAPVVRTLAAGTRAALAGARQLGVQVGNASFYSGGRTASGGFVGGATCAHRSLPFGTRVLVTNLANAHQAVLTVNDRGPFVRGRIIDVSTGAAGMLGMLHAGTAPVRVQVVGRPG